MRVAATNHARLTIQPDQPPGPDAVRRRINVTDSRFAVVATGFGDCDVALPGGVYRVNVESSEQPFVQTIILAPGGKEKIIYPGGAKERLLSPAPVPGSSSMHAYLREPLKKLCIPQKSTNQGARLVVMATRQAEHDAPVPIQLTDCRLWNSEGKKMAGFGNTEQASPEHLWAGMGIDLSPGGYVLDWPTPDGCPEPCVRQSIWLTHGWCLLIFVPVFAGERRPDPSKMSIHCNRLDESFVPEDSGGNINDPVAREQGLLELALQSLVRQHLLLPLENNDWLVHHKFENPMLGLIGAHLLLESPKPNHAELDGILKRLETMLPDHPDVTALRILAGGEPRTVQWPPMLRAGYAAVRKADWEVPGIIPQGSLADYVRTRINSGGVWTRWLGKKSADQWSPATKNPVVAKKSAAPFAAVPGSRRGASTTGAGGKKSSAATRSIKAESKHMTWPAKVGARSVGAAKIKSSVGAANIKKSAMKIAARATKSFPGAVSEALATVDQSITDQIHRFVDQARAAGRRVLKTVDLSWTGLSTAQADAALDLFGFSTKASSKPKVASVRRKPAAKHAGSPSLASVRRKKAASKKH